MGRFVIALGGNAIIQPGQRGTADEQLTNVNAACRHIAELVASGVQVVLTHGNGPQVGNALIRSEKGSVEVPPLPLDVCGAETQGELGYYIQQALGNHLRRRGVVKTVATVVTQTCVDRDDPAFANPTKPVGPFYDEDRAQQLRRALGWIMVEDSGRGWRRVVPSPIPKRLMETAAVKALLEAGAVVVASGGGGVPVTTLPDGSLAGVEAVIDKDLAAAVLARDVKANCLIILTDVDGAYVAYRKPGQRLLRRLSVVEAERLLEAGEFGVGSMGPKVRAAVSFARMGGTALITALEALTPALAGETGTLVNAAPPDSAVAASED
ncbi:MAG: carbamate kinase [Bacillota bacterium]|nr:MAG: carbamate kinase [Bacillota bacterium]